MRKDEGEESGMRRRDEGVKARRWVGKDGERESCRIGEWEESRVSRGVGVGVEEEERREREYMELW